MNPISRFFTSMCDVGRSMFNALFLYFGIALLFTSIASAIIDDNENGASDLWEKHYNSGNLYPNFNATADPDGDGWNNAQEADAGTDPLDGNPPTGFVRPEIEHIPAVYQSPEENGGEPTLASPEAFRIQWPTLVGKTYTLFSSVDLNAQSWRPLGGPRIGSGSILGEEIPLTQPDGGIPPALFLRVAVGDTDIDGDSLTNAEEHQIGSSVYLSDTDGDGIDDATAYAAGNHPAGEDADGDGVPDNALYSVEFEVTQESHITDSVGHEALTGTDNLHRYLTLKTSEEYSISGSPYCSDIANGEWAEINSYVKNGISQGNLSIHYEGITRSDSYSAHQLPPLASNERLEFDPRQTSITSPPISATENVTTTTTTTTTPWRVRNSVPGQPNTILRSGTEIITDTYRRKLSDRVTPQELWANYFKEIPWTENNVSSTILQGPRGPSFSHARVGLGDVKAAELLRDFFRNGDFSVGGTISNPHFSRIDYSPTNFHHHVWDVRLKSLRWRWVRFNPLTPFDYDYAAPPASYQKNFRLLVRQRNTTYLQPGFTPETDETIPKGIVEIECNGSEGAGWHTVAPSKYDAYKVEEPAGHATLDFTKSGESKVSFGNFPVEMQKKIPEIADNGGATTYTYTNVSSIPREVPLPGVEITSKDIANNQITITAEIYDVLSDVTGDSIILSSWVNSRETTLAAGDKPGVYRLQDYQYKLYPGRNEITLAVENSLGGRGSETIVVVGDDQGGYEISGEPVRLPLHPTYPVVFKISDVILEGGGVQDRTINLGMAGRVVDILPDAADDQPQWYFRSKPFISVLKPDSATQDQIDNVPSDKPIFLAELDDDLTIKLHLPSSATPAEWTVPQFGLQRTSPESVEIMESDELHPALEFKARGMGESPDIHAKLTTYQNDEAEQDVTTDFNTSYQTAYGALAANAKNDPVTFTVSGLTLKEGYNALSFDFTSSREIHHGGDYHTFLYPAPTKTGVRVFSANRKTDTVLDGVTSRPQDTWYPVESDTNLTDLSKALATSGCKVVGMTDVNGCFDDSPLRRSFLVRGPPGRTFQAFDGLYASQGRTQRSQSFAADGTNGATLAGELDRVQTDGDLPASAKNALALEIAKTYQLHNGFEDLVPKTHQTYIDPGNGTQQPNSWTMRGSSLPDHLQSNPSPWSVINTLSDPARAASASGNIKIDTTAENTAYYATTAATAPWNLNGARAVSLRFKLLAHDATNGVDGAFQLAAGDGARTWTCLVAPTQIRTQGVVIALPLAKFSGGLIDGQFHTLQFNLSGTGNDALVSIDGEVLAATVTAQPGTLNGIAFGDPGAGLAGKFETESLGCENSDLKYQYGHYDADDYADSDEIDGASNILLYLRSKGQQFRTSAVAKWVKILDPKVYEWLLAKYTTKTSDGSVQELHILTNKDVWQGSIVDMDVYTDVGSPFNLFDSKVTNTLVLDKEETKVWSTDKIRTEMQLAGILMAWTYEQPTYKSWLAEQVGGGTAIDGLLVEKKHFVENLAKCAKNVETTLALSGEIAVCMTNEYADYAITLNAMRQGDYMAMVGFIPFVPSSTARAFKFVSKADGAVIESIHQLSTKLDDFPGGVHSYVDDHGITRKLDFDKLFCDAADPNATVRLRSLTGDLPVSAHSPGAISGKEVLSTFANGSATIFKTREPLKVYRVYENGKGIQSNFFLFEKPQSVSQAVADQALINPQTGVPWQNYDRYVEVEIPADQYVYLGYASKMTDAAPGGGTQIWVDDTTVTAIDWSSATSFLLPP